ncbi:MAG: hypothetical protein IJ874_07880, partial [Ruminococcus sp.]|nr:hypothetical protein [Ruminococcus sp.]
HVVDFLLKGSNYKPLPCVHRQGELPKLPIYKHIKCDTNINHLLGQSQDNYNTFFKKKQELSEKYFKIIF